MAQAHIQLQSMNVDALLKLRDDIGIVLSDKRRELETQLQRLDGEAKRSSRTSLNVGHSHTVSSPRPSFLVGSRHSSKSDCVALYTNSQID